MAMHNLRDKQGRFRSIKPASIVAGRLYGFRGIPVRASSVTQRPIHSGEVLRQVTCHKLLSGFVPEAELTIIDRTKVDAYLQGA